MQIGGIITPLQRCIRCILQPQSTSLAIPKDSLLQTMPIFLSKEIKDRIYCLETLVPFKRNADGFRAIFSDRLAKALLLVKPSHKIDFVS